MTKRKPPKRAPRKSATRRAILRPSLELLIRTVVREAVLTAMCAAIRAELEPALRNILRDYDAWQKATIGMLEQMEKVPKQLQDHNWIITGILNHLTANGFDYVGYTTGKHNGDGRTEG